MLLVGWVILLPLLLMSWQFQSPLGDFSLLFPNYLTVSSAELLCLSFIQLSPLTWKNKTQVKFMPPVHCLLWPVFHTIIRTIVPLHGSHLRIAHHQHFYRHPQMVQTFHASDTLWYLASVHLVSLSFQVSQMHMLLTEVLLLPRLQSLKPIIWIITMPLFVTSAF